MRRPKLTLAERNELRSICFFFATDYSVFADGSRHTYDFFAATGQRHWLVASDDWHLGIRLFFRLYFGRHGHAAHHCQGRSHSQLHYLNGGAVVLLPNLTVD